jgi:predicted peptidase
MVEALQRLEDADPDEVEAEGGREVRLTVYPEAGHEAAWTMAYDDPELYEWLLQQSR